MAKRMLVVRNPKAGSFLSQNTFLEAAGVIFKSDYNVYVYTTQCRGDAIRVVAEEGEGYDYIVAFGGDGTLHEVINGLMQLEKRPVLGYIPAGTTNDFAAGLGLYKNAQKAAGTVIHGAEQELDVGKFGSDQYFSYVASFGTFTKASYSAPQEIKNLIGYAAYLLEGIKSLADVHSYHLTLQTETETIEDEFIFGAVSNALSVGGVMKFDRNEVDLCDGLFEILMIKTPRSISAFQTLVYDIAMHRYNTEQIIYCKASKVFISGKEPVAWTVDGENGGTVASVDIQNCHKAIRILKPKGNENA